MSLFNELKRRNVFRVAIAYGVIAWLILQVADVFLNNVDAPGWVFHVIVLLLGIGAVLVLVFSWVFELTPEGLKRQHEVDQDQSISGQTGKKLDRLITGVLVVALGYFVIDKFVLQAGREQAAVEAALQEAGAEIVQAPARASGDPDHSIAVLPFVNMSSDPEQEYFSDGLSEELLNLLAKIPELKVASRSSSFQFKGEKFDLTEVARQLNVDHVLEGSVRKSGDRLRITAQLIQADDGFHLWSETYDRPMDDIFAIQDEISAAVVDALKIELLGAPPEAEVVDPEAYALWLKGRYFYALWGKNNFERAIEALDQALELDPDFARAWASLAVAYLTQAQSGYRDQDEGVRQAKQAIEKALSINPDLPDVRARETLILSQFEWRWAEAEQSLAKAYAVAPRNSYVLNALGILGNATGEFALALKAYETQLEQEPLDLIALYNRANMLHLMGRRDEAEATYRYLLELNPEDWGSHAQLATILLQEGRAQEAWDVLENEVDPIQQEWGRLLALHSLGREAEAQTRLDAFIEEQQSWASSLIAQVYAWQGDRDEAFRWLNRSVSERDTLASGIQGQPLLQDLREDPRWDQLMAQMGLA
ncbi:MAG: tetratricopeptide repeat protein, partial [Xanthomonadales bacterium]|nr:tetratricopeptide repeat protein [Xanthomonadales bacterium]